MIHLVVFGFGCSSTLIITYFIFRADDTNRNAQPKKKKQRLKRATHCMANLLANLVQLFVGDIVWIYAVFGIFGFTSVTIVLCHNRKSYSVLLVFSISGKKRYVGRAYYIPRFEWNTNQIKQLRRV